MSRNAMFLLVALFAGGAGALGYWLYDQQTRSVVDISIGGTGFSVRER